MSEEFNNESMTELYLFESTTLLDNLDSILLTAESERNLSQEDINEVFRIMHTIKGSSAMMEFNVIADVSHKAEDLFAVIRDSGIPEEHFDNLFDLVLRVSGFLEQEVTKIQEGEGLTEEPPEMIKELQKMTEEFKANAPDQKPKMDVGRSLGGVERPKEVKQPEPASPEPVGIKTPEPMNREPEPVQVKAPEPVIREPEPITITPQIILDDSPEEIQSTNTQTTIPSESVEVSESSMPVAAEGGRILGLDPVSEPVVEQTTTVESNTNDFTAGTPFDAKSFEPVRKISGAASEAESSLMTYNLHVHFNEGSKMENIRAFMLVNKLNETGTVDRSIPDNLENNADAVNEIMENGFYVKYTTSLFKNQIEAIAKGTLSVESIAFVRKLPDEKEVSVTRVVPETPPSPQVQVSQPQSTPIPEVTPVATVQTPVQSNEAVVETNAEINVVPVEPQAQPIVEEPQYTTPTAEIAPESINEIPESNAQPTQGEAVSEPIADEIVASENAEKSEASSEASNEEQNQPSSDASKATNADAQSSSKAHKPTKQNIISVDLTKLDSLLDLVGEIVITESMVTQNSDLEGMALDSFTKAARQLNKLTDELQDTVMSVRMVPVSTTFQRMRLTVRNMAKKLGKETELILIGEQTEVDKTMLDALVDPLMHLVRNAMDHAIESPEERQRAGKNPTGQIILSAQNMGGDVIISVSDDGKGLDAEAILERAASKNLLKKPESEYTEKEIFHLLMMPGFSTKEKVTEFSGRGVGMDVVKSNIEKIGGTVIIESVKGTGTNILLKLPLTLAIIDCMEILVGNNIFAIPITNIKESFKASAGQMLTDPLGSEMIMIRGVAYPIVRLHSVFGIDDAEKNIDDGILILVDSGDKIGCLLADSLIGKFQVVVKPVPKYLSAFNVKSKGISGCTIMGNGEISLILDIQEILL